MYDNIIVYSKIAVVFFTGVLSALIGWYVGHRQYKQYVWQVKYEAFTRAEMEANTESFLKVHKITKEDLDSCGLDKDTFRQYLLWTNVIWASQRNNSRYTFLKMRTYFKSYTESVNYAIKKKIIISDSTHSGKLLQSEGYEKAWPIIKKFWSTSNDATIVQLIEATIRYGAMNRSKVESVIM